MQKVYDCIEYSTKTLTWYVPGAVPSSILCLLRKYDETLISSISPTASGDGRYFASVPHPGSAQWVINEWIAVINGNTYINRQFGHVLDDGIGAP